MAKEEQTKAQQESLASKDEIAQDDAGKLPDQTSEKQKIASISSKQGSLKDKFADSEEKGKSPVQDANQLVDKAEDQKKSPIKDEEDASQPVEKDGQKLPVSDVEQSKDQASEKQKSIGSKQGSLKDKSSGKSLDKSDLTGEKSPEKLPVSDVRGQSQPAKEDGEKGNFLFI